MNEPKKYDLADIIRQECEARPGIVIQAGSRTFELPPVVLWSDKLLATLAEAQQGSLAAIAALGPELLGPDYPDFVAAGGTGTLLVLLLSKGAGDAGESSASTDS